ncbi:MAG: zf-HC2 domain-containing protein [Bacteroidales bacterium]|nr:zf-HC2 domain-containing protein [Bacteroidales bacterium]
MNCKEIDNNIWEYIEGSLDESTKENFIKHFENCTQCAAAEKGMRASMTMIDQTKKTKADPFFFARLEARMERENQHKIPKKSFAVRYAMAASIAFIGIIGGSIFGSYSAEQLSSNFDEKANIEQSDDYGFELADNSFDLIKDFE